MTRQQVFEVVIAELSQWGSDGSGEVTMDDVDALSSALQDACDTCVEKIGDKLSHGD